MNVIDVSFVKLYYVWQPFRYCTFFLMEHMAKGVTLKGKGNTFFSISVISLRAMDTLAALLLIPRYSRGSIILGENKTDFTREGHILRIFLLEYSTIYRRL